MTANITRIIIAIALAAVSYGCQNNGDIGYLFGTWRIDSLTADGEEQPEAAEQTLISFQNDIIMVQQITDDDGSYTNYFGTWAEDGDRMTINFTHHQDSGPFPAPIWLGWTADEPMVMQVSDRHSRSVTWTYMSPDGIEYVYNLHKTW